ncbi:TPA: hypothetical protein ACGF19_003472, partial [Vibrio cholerae]
CTYFLVFTLGSQLLLSAGILDRVLTFMVVLLLESVPQSNGYNVEVLTQIADAFVDSLSLICYLTRLILSMLVNNHSISYVGPRAYFILAARFSLFK